MNQVLIGIPTLNEAKNVPLMVKRLLKIPLAADILFIDDQSTDGTGDLLDSLAREHPSIRVIHRGPCMGIGSAHRDILRYAYDKGYESLVTMDCDFSHQPEDISRLFSTKLTTPIVVGSRFLDEKSLEDWNIKRKLLTHLGHFLTHRLLGLPMDATGAFRLYRIRMIPQNLWDQVTSSGYSFFFESLAVLHRAGVACDEVSIHLPKRVYGESKLNMRQAFRSLLMLFEISLRRDSVTAMPNDARGWDCYWRARDVKGRHWYAVLASIYRRLFIVDRLHAILRNEFSAGAVLLHVGCGGGEVDVKSFSDFQITGVDISPEALALYRHHYPKAKTLRGNILEGPVGDGADGIYSLGLVEHFSHPDIIKILISMHSSVKVGGKAVIFWPHRFAPSVFVLRIISGIRKLIGWSEPLHPPEPSLLFSQNEAREIIGRTPWRIRSYDYGPRDLWIQATLVLEAGV